MYRIYLTRSSQITRKLQLIQPTACSLCGTSLLAPKERDLKVSSVTRQCRRQSSYYTFPLFTGTQYALETFHLYSGLPWWSVICLTTLFFRGVVTFPLAVKQHELIARIELLRPTLKEIVDAVKHNIVIRGQRDGKGKLEIQKELTKEIRLYTKDFYKRNGVSPWKLFLLPWTQLPVWITLSFALRNISGFIPKDVADLQVNFLPSTGIQTEGLFWFTDMSAPDPYYIIPTVLLLSNFINIEMNALKSQSPTTLTRVFTNTFRCLTVLMFFVSTQVPSVLSFYWALSSSYGLAQNVLMKYPSIRRKLKIPTTPMEKEHPFVDKLDILKGKMKGFLETQRAKQ